MVKFKKTSLFDQSQIDEKQIDHKQIDQNLIDQNKNGKFSVRIFYTEAKYLLQLVDK